MNVLIITKHSDTASFRQRIGIYIDALKKNNITCQTALLPSGSIERIKLYKRTAKFDAVFLFKKRLKPWAAFWLRKYAKKIIFDFDDAIMYSSHGNNSRHLSNFARSVKISDLVLAGNSYLAEHAKKFNSAVVIFPTGLKIKDYSISPHKTDDKIRLVWIGTKNSLYCLEGIKSALEQIGSRFDNVVLRIISDKFFDLQNMSVEKRPWSIKTQAEDLVNSDIGLAPLPDSDFTRGKCGFKILQYAASALPIVASPVGVNSDFVIDNVTGFHATEISKWVQRLTTLILDHNLRKQMAQESRKHVEDFDSEVLGEKLYDLIKKCTENC